MAANFSWQMEHTKKKRIDNFHWSNSTCLPSLGPMAANFSWQKTGIDNFH
jgi:hypothetical protein